MKEENKKNFMLVVRIRKVDRSLLEEVCKRQGWGLSECIRRAITDQAAKLGLHSVAGFIVERGTINDR